VPWRRVQPPPPPPHGTSLAVTRCEYNSPHDADPPTLSSAERPRRRRRRSWRASGRAVACAVTPCRHPRQAFDRVSRRHAGGGGYAAHAALNAMFTSAGRGTRRPS
jgi:hypothetical protein